MLYVRDEYLYKKITIVLLIFSISLLLDINKDEKKEDKANKKAILLIKAVK